MSDHSNIVVIGAGIVGVQLARALQREGFSVTLVDKQEAGRATSFGNAGFIASDEIFPLAHGRVLKSIPRLLTDPLGPLAINWRQIPRLMPWVYQFAKACSGRSAKRNIDALAGLQKFAATAWREILIEEGITTLIQDNGAYKIFETQKGFDETAWERSEQTD
ncbi:MAG: FAD-dependent oxidoreductase [Gammaproteobacteria bacterium]